MLTAVHLSDRLSARLVHCAYLTIGDNGRRFLLVCFFLPRSLRRCPTPLSPLQCFIIKKKTTTFNRSTSGSERGETVAAALHRLGDCGHAAVAPGVGSASTAGKSQVYHGSKTNRRSFMLISETLRMATRRFEKEHFFSRYSKNTEMELPSEHGGMP